MSKITSHEYAHERSPVGNLEDTKAPKYVDVKISKRYQEEFLEFATYVWHSQPFQRNSMKGKFKIKETTMTGVFWKRFRSDYEASGDKRLRQIEGPISGANGIGRWRSGNGRMKVVI
jgi:hypothetical protein